MPASAGDAPSIEAVEQEHGLSRLSDLNGEILAEVVREGELLLQAQLQASLSADQRAFHFAGFAVAASTALTAAAAAISQNAGGDALLVGIAGGVALLLLISAGLAVLSARPVSFFFPGNEPVNWLPQNWERVEARKTLKGARIEQAECIQASIAHNRQTSLRNGRMLRGALILAYAAITLGSIAALTLITVPISS